MRRPSRFDDRETSGAIDFDAALETYMETGDAEELQEFIQDTEYGQELVSAWGEKAAPAMLGRARREVQLLWNTMTATLRLRVERFIAARPAAHKVAIIKALAARVARRL